MFFYTWTDGLDYGPHGTEFEWYYSHYAVALENISDACVFQCFLNKPQTLFFPLIESVEGSGKTIPPTMRMSKYIRNGEIDISFDFILVQIIN